MIRYSLGSAGEVEEAADQKTIFCHMLQLLSSLFSHFFFWAGHGTLEIRAVML